MASNQHEINKIKKLQTLASELADIINEEEAKDCATIVTRRDYKDVECVNENGRYCGDNTYAKHLELEIDRIYSELLGQYEQLTHYCARNFKSSNSSGYADLIAVAQAAIYKGLMRYDTSYEHPVMFLAHTINGEILRYYRDYCWIWKLPRTYKEALSTRETDLDIISEKYNISKEEIEELKQLSTTISHEEYFAESEGSDVFDSSDDMDREILIEHMLSTLPDVEADVIRLSFIEGRDGQEIADILLIPTEDVDKIKEYAISILSEKFGE